MKIKKHSKTSLRKENKSLQEALAFAQKHRDDIRNLYQEKVALITKLEKEIQTLHFSNRYNSITKLVESVAFLNQSLAQVVGEVGNAPYIPERK